MWTSVKWTNEKLSAASADAGSTAPTAPTAPIVRNERLSIAVLRPSKKRTPGQVRPGVANQSM
jgi:hypothetical protein